VFWVAKVGTLFTVSLLQKKKIQPFRFRSRYLKAPTQLEKNSAH